MRFETKPRHAPTQEPAPEAASAGTVRPAEALPAGTREYYGLSVQKKALSVPLSNSSEELQAAAQEGTRGAGQSLPHLDRIQASFGRHDVSGVRAHVDGGARAAAKTLDAQAFTVGNQVAFGGAADLHTTAHEAAHVVQQRGGVQLKSNVGEVGDAYESHADAVAERVERGESAESLLDQMAGGGGTPAVQRKPMSVAVTNAVEITIEYNEAPWELKDEGKKWVVELPSAFPIEKRAVIADQLKCQVFQIQFVNKLDDTWQQGPIGSNQHEKKPGSLNDEKKKATFAGNRITGFLTGMGITELDGAKIEELVARQTGAISFVDPPVRKQGEGPTEEGHTDEGKRGERAIVMTRGEHNWPAVVHEVLRALAHPGLVSLPRVVVDDILERLTREATGLDVRRSPSGKEYLAQAEAVRAILAESTSKQLGAVYFLGQIQTLTEILETIEEKATPYQGEFNLTAIVGDQISVKARERMPMEVRLAKQGKRLVAKLPVGLSPTLLPNIAGQLGCEVNQIHFINVDLPTGPQTRQTQGPPQSMFNLGPFAQFGRQEERGKEQQTFGPPRSTFNLGPFAQFGKQEERQKGPEKQDEKVGPKQSVDLAVVCVREYLAKVGITELDDQKIEAVLLLQSKKVQFFNQNHQSREMDLFMRGYGGPSAESTEGFTKQDKGSRFERPIGINTDNHSWGTVVHELFHGLEHPGLRKLSDMLVEGMTEVLTRRATGLDQRCGRGGGEIYQVNVRMLQMALDNGVITEAELRAAYFSGAISRGLLQVNEACEGPGKLIQPGHKIASPEEVSRGWQDAQRMLPLSLTGEEAEREFDVRVNELKQDAEYARKSTGHKYRYDGPALSKHNFLRI